MLITTTQGVREIGNRDREIKDCQKHTKTITMDLAEEIGMKSWLSESAKCG